jgi:hypothetical protein
LTTAYSPFGTWPASNSVAPPDKGNHWISADTSRSCCGSSSRSSGRAANSACRLRRSNAFWMMVSVPGLIESPLPVSVILDRCDQHNPSVAQPPLGPVARAGKTLIA